MLTGVCEGVGEGRGALYLCEWPCLCVLFCVLRAQIVLWQTVKTTEAAPAHSRNNGAAASAMPRPPSRSLPLPPGFSQFAVSCCCNCVCVCVWFWLRLCVSLCSKSSLFSSYLLKPIMRSQAHLNALPPDHFILLLFCLRSFSLSPSSHLSLCCRWCCLCVVRLFLLPRVLKAFQCTRLLLAAHLKYSLQMPTQQF